MNVYVASSFHNKTEVRQLQQMLRNAGHNITHDWTGEDATGLEGDARRLYLEDCGDDDFMGVEEADVFVMIVHEDCKDTFTEFGMALMGYCQTVLVHKERNSSVFFHRADYTAVDNEAAVVIVNVIAKQAAECPF